jgi:YfiH family protein
MIHALSLVAGNGVGFYQFPRLRTVAGLRHAVFTRRGGNSEGPYQGLNVSYSVGDDPRSVQENRSLIATALGLEKVHSLKQVHGREAVVISEQEAVPSFHPETRCGDILMTRMPGQGLMIKQADCQAVILYDPEGRALALVHCGWRGNVADVLGEAVRKMNEVFGSDPARLFAAIGPSLGPCCAEFIHYRREFPPSFWSYQVRPHYFDLWRLSRDQLIAAGVRKERIETAGLCTSCRTDLFFSYRKEKITGRFATVAALT